jgi:carbon monoxide dehydrogenase subunit G
MRIENTVEVDAPLDRVWALVNDIPRVAPCMPGAALTGMTDDQTYEGTVAVKLGPLRMTYKGKVVVEEVDEANHSARLAASGKDTKGAGTAKASVETRMEPAGDGRTRLMVTSDVQLTGKVASFGRGGAINDVASRLFGQFAECLRTTLESEQAATTPQPEPAAAPPSAAAGTVAPPEPAAAPPPAAAGTVAPSEPVAAGDGATAAGDDAAAVPAATVTPGSAPVSPVPAPPPRPVEALDAGSLVGTVIKGRLRALAQAIAAFFRRLFGRRRRSKEGNQL